MNILGGVIKQVINLKHGIEDSTQSSPVENQLEQLRNLLKKAKDTAFGKYYNFEGILESPNIQEEFRKRIPVHDYDKMHGEWWKQQLQYPDITWPGKPNYFARSSGTTGSEPKRIPVTDDMIESIRSVGIAQLTSVANFDLPTEFFEKQILMLGSSTKLTEVGDHEEGEISGISASNIPGWFDSVYKPGHEIASISDWDERVARIAKEAPNWDIGAASGIPSWLLLLFKEVLKVNKAESIHDIWPDFKLYTTGGVAFEPYRMAFEELFKKDVIIMDTYLASEGFFAFNARPETNAMQLATQHDIYYEFIPFDERGFDDEGNVLDSPEVHTLEEVDTETNYAMIISTCSGAWRYMIGDTVKFDNLEHYEIVISGRTKYFLNVVGSQLSEDKMNAAVEKVSSDCSCPIDEFTVAAVRDDNGDYYHEWILGVEDGRELDSEETARKIDESLKDLNKNYAVARSKALKGVKVYPVPTSRFHDWHAKSRKKGGQIKTKKLMSEEDFKEFRDFVLEKK